jgi:hypothetical protein
LKIQNPELCDTMMFENGSDRRLSRNQGNASRSDWLWEEAGQVSSSRKLEFDIDLDHALTDAQLSENEDYWGDGQNEGCSATLRRRWKV